MNTKSIVAAIAGVLMVGATTVGAGMALADDEPALVEADPVAVQSTGEYAEGEYEDDEDHEEYEEHDDSEEYEDHDEYEDESEYDEGDEYESEDHEESDDDYEDDEGEYDEGEYEDDDDE